MRATVAKWQTRNRVLGQCSLSVCCNVFHVLYPRPGCRRNRKEINLSRGRGIIEVPLFRPPHLSFCLDGAWLLPTYEYGKAPTRDMRVARWCFQLGFCANFLWLVPPVPCCHFIWVRSPTPAHGSAHSDCWVKLSLPLHSQHRVYLSAGGV